MSFRSAVFLLALAGQAGLFVNAFSMPTKRTGMTMMDPGSIVSKIPNPFSDSDPPKQPPRMPSSNAVLSDATSSLDDFESGPEGLIARAKVVIASDLGIQNGNLLAENFIWIGPYLDQPLGKVDYLAAGRFFDLRSTFPDLDYRAHDYRVDKVDPNTVRVTARTVGTMRGELRLRDQTLPPNGQQMRCPPEAISITFDPDGGKVLKLCTGFSIDRLVGNTKGLCGVSAAATVAGEAPSEWELYPAPKVLSRFFGRPEKPIGESTSFLAPFPETVMVQLAKGILSSNMAADDPTLLSRDFTYMTPTKGPIGKDKFLEEFAAEEFAGVEPELSHFRVDPYDPNRVWVDVRPLGPGYEGPPQAMSFSFDDDGFCTRVTSGYVMDPSLGNAGGLGGPEGFKYATGNASPAIVTRPLPRVLGRIQKSVTSPITGIGVDDYALPEGGPLLPRPAGQASSPVETLSSLKADRIVEPPTPPPAPAAPKIEVPKVEAPKIEVPKIPTLSLSAPAPAKKAAPAQPKDSSPVFSVPKIPTLSIPTPKQQPKSPAKKGPSKAAAKKPVARKTPPKKPVAKAAPVTKRPTLKIPKLPTLSLPSPSSSASKSPSGDQTAARKAQEAKAKADAEKRRQEEANKKNELLEAQKKAAEEAKRQRENRLQLEKEKREAAKLQQQEFQREQQRLREQRQEAARKEADEKRAAQAAQAAARRQQEADRKAAAEKKRQELQQQKEAQAAARRQQEEERKAAAEKKKQELQQQKEAQAAARKQQEEERKAAAEKKRQELQQQKEAQAAARRQQEEAKKAEAERKRKEALKEKAASAAAATASKAKPGASISLFGLGQATPGPAPAPKKPAPSSPPRPTINLFGAGTPAPAETRQQKAAEAATKAKPGATITLFGLGGTADDSAQARKERATKAEETAKKASPGATINLFGLGGGEKPEPTSQAKRATKAVAAAEKAKPGATINLFGLGSAPAETKAPPKSVVKKAPALKQVAPKPKPVPKKSSPKAVAPRGVPTISGWKKNGDGSITGSITGSPNFRNGERVTTSPISQGAITSGSVVRTASGSRYFLS